jgi:hypothetical protein
MGEAVVSGCDSAEILEAPEHALDGVALTLGCLTMRIR